MNDKSAPEVVQAKVETVDTTETINQILERLTKLEAKADALVNGLEWAATQIRPMYIIGAMAPVLDAVAKGLKK